MSRSLSSLQRLCGIALMSAVAFLVLLVMRLPLFPAAAFLDYECKDVVFAVAGMMYGPAGGTVVALVTCLIEFFTVSHTGWIGLVMNLVSSLSFVLPVAFLYQKKHTATRALVGLVIGALLSCATMLLWNVIFTPMYMGIPRAAVIEMLLPVFLPFNLLKGSLNAGLCYLLWHLLAPLLAKARLLNESRATTPFSMLGILLPAALLLTGSIVAILLLR